MVLRPVHDFSDSWLHTALLAAVMCLVLGAVIKAAFFTDWRTVQMPIQLERVVVYVRNHTP